ncbi:MAG: PKD domain-containing protein [Christiangramia sp.]
MLIVVGCSEEDYSLGELTAPSNLTVNVDIAGQSGDNPNGDGSGDVIITASADDALAYKIDFGTVDGGELVPFKGTTSKKYTKTGTNDYRITVVAYGAGGSSTTVTKDITVMSQFNPEPKIVSDLTGEGSKTWVVAKSVAGHFGVGPFEGSTTPEWYAATPNEKADCCGCFYSASFTFSQTDGGFTLSTNTPDGAFTKTGALTTLPGIPGSGDEACYDYSGGSSAFSFIPSSTGISDTGTSIELVGNETYIGYGALMKEYEILEINESYMYLRVQGTETGNAWYLKLVPAE